jgi:O-antigen/teichoic acid export membrane protein
MTILGFLDLGLGLTVNREISILRNSNDKTHEIPDLIYSVEKVFIVISIIILFITLALSPVISTHWLKYNNLTINQVTRSFVIISFIIAFRWPSSLYYNILIGFQRFDILNTVKIIYTIFIGLGSVFVIKYFSNTIEAYLIWNLVVNIIHIFCLKIIIYQKFISEYRNSGSFNKKLLQRLKTFSLGVAIYTLLASAYPMANNFILPGIFDLTEFGYFALILNLSLGITQIVYPILSVFFPKFSKIKNLNVQRFTFHESFHLILILTTSIIVNFILFSDDIIFLWTNNIELLNKTKKITTPLFLGTFLYALRILPFSAFIAQGRVKTLIKYQIIIYLFFIPFLIYGANMGGLIGASKAWFYSNVIGFILSLRVISKIFNPKNHLKLFLDIFLPMIAILIFTFFNQALLKMFDINFLYKFFINLTITTLIGFSSSKSYRKYLKLNHSVY